MIEIIKEIVDKKNLIIALKSRNDIMPNGQMEYIREKCENGEPISKEELLKYAKSYEIKNKIYILETEIFHLRNDLQYYNEKMEDILKCGGENYE